MDAMKKFQEMMTSIFYLFTKSSKRYEDLHAIQDLLNEPQLRFTEVHSVRWFSFYKALETMFRCYASLVTFLENDKNLKCEGLARKLKQFSSLAILHLMMDVMPVMTELCLVFQKRDLDVSLVFPNVEHCMDTLKKLRAEPGHFEELMAQDLQDTDGALVYHGIHILFASENHKIGFTNMRHAFLNNLIENLESRFPQRSKDLIQEFAFLGMRPISFMGKDERGEWGNQAISDLCSHYNMDSDKALSEWKIIKELVCAQQYPRDKLRVLWSIINKFHKAEVPTLLHLASLALTLPIHTADVERGFSLQNDIKTATRNRLKADRLQTLLTIRAEGASLAEFDALPVLKQWANDKKRKLLQE